MSNTDNDPILETPDELTALKTRADLMGVRYHPSISLEKLREKVNASIESNEPNSEDKAVEAAQEAAYAAASAPIPVETDTQRRTRKKREANELVRIRVTCMNPAKRDWDGEIFTAGNAVVGSFTKFVPFNVEDGWHVPQIILTQMQARMCQIFTTHRDNRGNSSRKGSLIKEFAIEVLPKLTAAELHDLAQRQAMAKSID